MVKKCPENLVFGSSIIGSVGWGLFGLSLISIIVLSLLKMLEIIPIADIYFWAVIIAGIVGATMGLIGSSILNACQKETIEPKPM